MPESDTPTTSKKASAKDPIEKRIQQLCKEANVELNPSAIRNLREAVIDAALKSLTIKSVVDVKIAELDKEREALRKRLS